jgi:hypothetical protein
MILIRCEKTQRAADSVNRFLLESRAKQALHAIKVCARARDWACPIVWCCMEAGLGVSNGAVRNGQQDGVQSGRSVKGRAYSTSAGDQVKD